MPKVTTLYAYVVADGDEDDEGVPAFNTPNGAMPLIGADIDRAEALRPVAQAISNGLGKPVRLVQSAGLIEVEVITPAEAADG